MLVSCPGIGDEMSLFHAGTDRLIVFPVPVEDEATIDTFLARHAELVVG